MADFLGNNANYLAYIMINRLTSLELTQIFKKEQNKDSSFSNEFGSSCVDNVIDCLAKSSNIMEELPSIIRRFVNAIALLNNDDFYFSVSYLESRLINFDKLIYKKNNAIYFLPNVEKMIRGQFVTRTNMIKEFFVSA